MQVNELYEDHKGVTKFWDIGVFFLICGVLGFLKIFGGDDDWLFFVQLFLLNCLCVHFLIFFFILLGFLVYVLQQHLKHHLNLELH